MAGSFPAIYPRRTVSSSVARKPSFRRRWAAVISTPEPATKMLRHLVELSLRSRGVVITLAIGLICYGLFVTTHAKLDVFPEFVQPQATVQTEAPGLAPEQVEALVTRPVEGVLNGVGHLDSIRSESIQGLSVVTAVFKEGTDIYKARQMLAERLAQLGGELPAGVT